MMNNRFNVYVTTDDDELINRENVWHFYAYFASEATCILQEFLELCDIPEKSPVKCFEVTSPSMSIGMDGFDKIKEALEMLIDYFEKGGLILNGQEINLEWGDPVRSLTESLHLFMNLLPYLNLRHYDLSKDRYDDEKYHSYSFEELQHLDQTLARRIFPTFRWFANHTIFSPQYFKRMFNYPRPTNYKSSQFISYKQWDKALEPMVEAWQWLRDRKPSKQKVEWEDIPDEVYYGLHLFAEYLPEMQND